MVITNEQINRSRNIIKDRINKNIDDIIDSLCTGKEHIKNIKQSLQFTESTPCETFYDIELDHEHAMNELKNIINELSTKPKSLREFLNFEHRLKIFRIQCRQIVKKLSKIKKSLGFGLSCFGMGASLITTGGACLLHHSWLVLIPVGGIVICSSAVGAGLVILGVGIGLLCYYHGDKIVEWLVTTCYRLSAALDTIMSTKTPTMIESSKIDYNP